MSAPAPRILVIRRRYLGDIVLLGSVFRNLRLHWPAAHVTALVESPHAGILALNPDVDAVLPMPRSLSNPPAWWRLVRALRAGRFTHVLDFDNTDKTALLARFTGAPLRVTLHLENVRRHFPSFYTGSAFVSSPDYSAQSIAETYLRLLAPAGVPVADHRVRLVPREADLAFVRDLLGRLFCSVVPPGTRFLLVHPGTRSPFRLWPPDHFGEICRRVRSELGAKVVLVAGPKEQEILRQVLRHAGADQMVIDQPLSVPQFAALAAQCDLVLCHDSGPMHVAAAVGTPVVALYGSQNATVWQPLGDGHTVLQPLMPCRNCLAPGVCVPGDSYRNHCIRNLTVDDVFAAVRRQLSRPAAPP
jgi:ADP-heptose:LPS heptosyltransferase